MSSALRRVRRREKCIIVKPGNFATRLVRLFTDAKLPAYTITQKGLRLINSVKGRHKELKWPK